MNEGPPSWQGGSGFDALAACTDLYWNASEWRKDPDTGKRKRIMRPRSAREDMLGLERNLHETLPIGPEEGQSIYIQIQIDKGLTPLPYQP